MVTKITGTRSYILVYFDQKVLRIEGELTLTPAFYANKESIKYWEPPNNGLIIDDEEKEDIVKQILTYSVSNPGVSIKFED
jgi:hypothetical protein